MTDLQRLSTALSDRYRIEHELGAGGMATVYLARDLKHDRQVALKVLRADLSAILGGERFLNEIRVTANLQHPHILPLFDSGDAEGLLFYVMPYVAGETLRQRIDREKQLPIEDAVRIAREVASALDYAHRQGVIHRDIKPENVLIQDGTALVTDFGIALAVSKAGGARLTETGLSLGTPFYMSPEQATGDRQLDARTDVYSLGAMLYEMLTGDPPHTGSTSQAVIAAVMTEEPRDVAARRPRVALHVAEAVHKALEKMPADRFPSAADFSRALEGPAVTAARAAARPIQRGARRRWMTAALTAVSALAGFLAGRVLWPSRALRETRTRLTFSGNASGPVVTHDGHWLAYIRGVCQASGADCGGDLVFQELPLGAPSVLIAGARDLAIGGWSPSGASILVWMRSAGGERGLYVLKRQGGVPHRVAGSATAFAFTDERTVAYTMRGQGTIRLVDAATGDLRDSIVIGDGRWVLNSLDFNSTNGLLYFAGFHGSRFVQGVADRRGKILDSLDAAGGGLWDTDGRHVMAFELSAQSMGRLLRIPVSRSGRLGRAVEVLGGIRQDAFTGFAATPSGFVMGDADRTADLWSFTVGGASRRLTHGSTWYYGPNLSPDGKTVAYIKQDAWGANIYTVPAAGGPETALTSDSGTRQLVRWQPDQRRISDVSLSGAGGSIVQETVDLQSGQVRTMAIEPGWIVIAWRPDGSAVAERLDYRAFAIADSSGHVLRRMPLPDSIGTLASAAISPDGQEMVFQQSGRASRVYVFQLADGGVRLLSTVSAPDSTLLRVARWAGDGFIYFARLPGSGRIELWRLPERGGALARFADVPLVCDLNSLALASDARSGACLVTDERPDLYLYELK